MFPSNLLLLNANPSQFSLMKPLNRCKSTEILCKSLKLCPRLRCFTFNQKWKISVQVNYGKKLLNCRQCCFRRAPQALYILIGYKHGQYRISSDPNPLDTSYYQVISGWQADFFLVLVDDVKEMCGWSLSYAHTSGVYGYTEKKLTLKSLSSASCNRNDSSGTDIFI